MPICVLCLGALAAVLFTFDGIVNTTIKQVNKNGWVSPVLNAFHIFLETKAAKSFRFVISKGGISVFFAELL
jgi:hypothetical protein